MSTLGRPFYIEGRNCESGATVSPQRTPFMCVCVCTRGAPLSFQPDKTVTLALPLCSRNISVAYFDSFFASCVCVCIFGPSITRHGSSSSVFCFFLVYSVLTGKPSDLLISVYIDKITINAIINSFALFDVILLSHILVTIIALTKRNTRQCEQFCSMRSIPRLWLYTYKLLSMTMRHATLCDETVNCVTHHNAHLFYFETLSLSHTIASLYRISTYTDTRGSLSQRELGINYYTIAAATQ